MADVAGDTVDLVVVGAGAAGLATAIFAARSAPDMRVVCLDGARHIGAKILVSGGTRCNVTNRSVTERDFWGGSPRAVRNVLRAFPAERAVAFFAELGVPLHEEEDGKLFPDTNRARTVLDALLREADRLGVRMVGEQRVLGIDRVGEGFEVRVEGAKVRGVEGAKVRGFEGAKVRGVEGATVRGFEGAGVYRARAIVLATGGRSLPKTGSDGAGYGLAASLGHGYVETTPALVPLLLDDDERASLSGVSHPAEIAIRVEGRVERRLRGSLLWTHFGASGPVVLNASRHWHRARLQQEHVDLLLNSLPGESFASTEEWLMAQQRERPRAAVASVLATRLPASIAAACASAAGVDTAATMAHLGREERRSLIRALVEHPLHVRDSRGYSFAEVTAGGVPLDEIDPASMESRVCEGLHLVGEILDVDGRLGGFNFQWAWSSGYVAGRGVAARLLGKM